MTFGNPTSWYSHLLNYTSSTSDFIGSQLDFLYLHWVASLIYPTILVVFVLPALILCLLYIQALILYIYKKRHNVYDVISETLEAGDPWVGGRYMVSLLWDAHGYIWHGYDVEGLENLPESGPALLIYYHGAIPLDMYYFVARVILIRGRLVHCVGDRFLEKVPGWKVILDAFHITPGTISSCIQTLSEGHILSIAPGGVREAQFSDHNYPLMWGNRSGYAKVAIESKVPVIPMFTENIREAFRVAAWPQFFWFALYKKFGVPLAPLYGGFPVKLRTHLGPPINPLPGETAEELSVRIREGVEKLIQLNQRLPGNILRALIARFYEKPKFR